MQPIVAPKGDHSLLTDTDLWWMQVMGRLKPGVSAQQAQAALAVQFDHAARATMTIKPGEDTAQLILADGSRGLGEIGRQFAQPIYVFVAVLKKLKRAQARDRAVSSRLFRWFGQRSCRATNSLTTNVAPFSIASKSGVYQKVFHASRASTV